MSYDEHKETRLLLEELREDYEDAQGNLQMYFRRWQTVSRERDALRERVEAVRALADDWDAASRRYVQYARGSSTPGVLEAVAKTLNGNSHELLSALSSSEPVTAGPERDMAREYLSRLTRDGSPRLQQIAAEMLAEHDEYAEDLRSAAGEVTPPAEQRAETCGCSNTEHSCSCGAGVPVIHRWDCNVWTDGPCALSECCAHDSDAHDGSGCLDCACNKAPWSPGYNPARPSTNGGQ